MITRTWSGQAIGENADAYLAHLRDELVPELEKIAGFCGITVLRREQAETSLFTVLTQWESMEAVRAFAGDTPDRAVVPDRPRALLASFDEFVQHHDTVIQTAS